jgi:hypothetical protein
MQLKMVSGRQLPYGASQQCGRHTTDREQGILKKAFQELLQEMNESNLIMRYSSFNRKYHK